MSSDVARDKDLPLGVEEGRFNIRVVNRDEVIFKGEAVYVSSVNDSGDFDVLGKHAHFISIIKEYLNIRLVDGNEKSISVDHGIMRVYDEGVEVYLGFK